MHVIGIEGNSKRLISAAVENIQSAYTLCWGTTTNPATKAINNVGRKNAIQQLDAFKAAGINTPEYTQNLTVAKAWVAGRSLVFGRQIEHTQGTDIVGPKDRRWCRKEYWIKVVPNVVEEWRIHVFNGKTIARGLKHQVEQPWRKMPVRNRHNGWHMRHDIEPTDALREFGKSMVGATGYDFGACDILKDQDGKLWALEVNKAPGLDEYTTGQYAKMIGKFVQRNG